MPPGYPAAAFACCRRIGGAIARLHDAGYVHGDLTTSNMMLRDGGGDIVLIDFGLSFGNPTPEDKAVDLYVLERALRSTHEESEGLFATVMQAYCDGSKGESEVVARLRKVQKRGRKRLCFG